MVFYYLPKPVWRPDFDTQVFGELKTGIGYLISFRPSKSFTQRNGVWTSIGKKGKGMFVIPTGIFSWLLS